MKAILNNQEISYQELREKFNLPENVIIEGCHVISNDQESVEKLRKLNTLRSFEVFGFGDEITKLLLNDDLFYEDPYRIFDCEILTEDRLVDCGFGPKQAKNYILGLERTYQNGIPFNLLVKSLTIDGCGNTITEQFTRRYMGMSYSEFGLTKEVWNKLIELQNDGIFDQLIDELTSYGYKVINTYFDVEEKVGDIKVVLTGSPKEFGFKTKAEFLNLYPNLIEVKKVQDADFLVTDNLTSTSSKMKDASKYGIKVTTYGDIQNQM